MVKLGDNEIQAVRSAANIVDIISSYIPVVQKGKDYKCVCPFHNDHSPSMSISTSKQIYKCFACGEAGNVFTFVEKYENVSFPEAVQIVAKKIGYTLSGVVTTNTTYKYQKEYDLMELVTKYYENNLASKDGVAAKEYLNSRGIDEKIRSMFQIGVSKDTPNALSELLTKKGYDVSLLENLGLSNIGNQGIYDVFARRITFPLWDTKGHVIGFSSRIYRGEETSKYINTKETYLFKKGENLFNYHRAKDGVKGSKYLLIVEGQMDAIRLYANGFTSVVALMGTALTKEQINLIQKLRCKVILCLDGDEAGKNATLKNGDLLLKAGLQVQVIRLSGAKDPDEYILKYGASGFQTVLDHVLDYFDFKMQAMKESIHEDNTEEVTAYIHSVLESLTDVSDPILRELTFEKLSKTYGIDVSILKERFQSMGNLANVAQEVFEQPSEKKVKEKSSAYENNCKKVLFYMMNDAKYVSIYQKELGFFENKAYRSIANLIVYYVSVHGEIHLADFISYTDGQEELRDLILEIASYEETLSESYFRDYLHAILKKRQEDEIKELRNSLKKELDMNRKIEIANRITELKKEVC